MAKMYNTEISKEFVTTQYNAEDLKMFAEDLLKCGAIKVNVIYNEEHKQYQTRYSITVVDNGDIKGDIKVI